MTETEYILATNRVKVSIALTILRDVIGGDEYGISQQELIDALNCLMDAQDKLFSSYSLNEEIDNAD